MKFLILSTLALGVGSVAAACGGTPSDETTDDSSLGGQPDSSGGASSGGTGDGVGGTAQGGQPNTDPPTVVSVMPASGAKGVDADAVIQITFSEPMDREMTASAYGSERDPIASEQVDFSWNSSSTVLTITPKAPLPYKEVGHLDDSPTILNFTLLAAAQDAQGQPMEEDFVSFFSPWKLMSQEIPVDITNSAFAVYEKPETNLIRMQYVADAGDDNCPAHVNPSSPGDVGGANGLKGRRSGVYSYSLADLVDRPLVSAKLTLFTTKRDIDWFSKLTLDKLESQTLSLATGAAAGAPDNLSYDTADGPQQKMTAFDFFYFDVTELVKTDLETESTWSMYRVGYDAVDLSHAASGNRVICAGMSLNVSYLVE